MAENGLQSGANYNAQFAAVSTVADMATAIFGSIAANKYVRPAAYINNDAVVIEEQHAPGGYKLLIVAVGLFVLVIGAALVGLIRAKK